MIFLKYLWRNVSGALLVVQVELLIAVALVALLSGLSVSLDFFFVLQLVDIVTVILVVVHLSLPIIILTECHRLHSGGKVKECYANLVTLIPYCMFLIVCVTYFESLVRYLRSMMIDSLAFF